MSRIRVRERAGALGTAAVAGRGRRCAIRILLHPGGGVPLRALGVLSILLQSPGAVPLALLPLTVCALGVAVRPRHPGEAVSGFCSPW